MIFECLSRRRESKILALEKDEKNEEGKRNILFNIFCVGRTTRSVG